MSAPNYKAELTGVFGHPVAENPTGVMQEAEVEDLLVDDGKMRVLANWGAERVASFPDLPTFRELGYKDVEFHIWAGLFAQSALPAPIMKQLRESMAQAVKAPEVIKTFQTAGSPVAYLDAPEFSKFVAEDSARPGRGGEEERQGGVERFPAKWKPVRVKKTRQTKTLRNPLHIFLSEPTSRGRIPLTGSASSPRGISAYLEIEEGRDPCKRSGLSSALRSQSAA